jgi:hypothetical protein
MRGSQRVIPSSPYMYTSDLQDQGQVYTFYAEYPLLKKFNRLRFVILSEEWEIGKVTDFLGTVLDK